MKLSISSRFSGRKTKKKDVLHFLDYLTDTLSVGLSVQDSISKYKPMNKKLSVRYKFLLNHLKKGLSFTQSLKKTKLMDETAIAVLEAGELSGKLEDVCRELKTRYSEDLKFTKDLKKMLMMPVIEVIAAISVTIFALLKVVPEVSGALSSFGNLPEFSKQVFAFSLFFKGHFFEIIIAFGIMAGMFFISLKSRVYVYFYQIPLLNRLLAYAFASRFFYQLLIMLNGGVPLIFAIRKIRNAAKNNYEKAALSYVIANLQRGFHFDDAIKKCRMKIMPEEVVSLMSVARLTGDYKSISEKLVVSMREKTKDSADKVARLIEPMAVMFLGVVVFFIVMAVYYPIISLTAK